MRRKEKGGGGGREDTCANQVPDKSVRQTDRQTVKPGVGGRVGGSLRQEEIISLLSDNGADLRLSN